MSTLYLLVLILSCASIASTMPGMTADFVSKFKRQSIPTLPLSQFEGNSGPIPSLVFNAADQFVDVRPGTVHQYVPPTSTDLRGPCPALNAAANHGFMPHNGISTIPQAIIGLGQAYNMGPDVAGLLATIAVALTGDPIAGTWSIGGPYPLGVLEGLLSNAEGISFSHNQYEADASVARYDAYLNHGDAHSLDLKSFDALYFSAENYTLDILRTHKKANHDYSVQNNPYFFSPPFAGQAASIAYHFVVNLMSNHSANNIQGYLDRNMLKSFFGVSGPDNAHVWNAGQEQIPQNWYRRPSSNPYSSPGVFGDVAILALRYPDVVLVGGNTGKVNTFTGVDPGNLTGGVYNAQTLFQGNNLACFAFQAAQVAIPSVLRGVISDLAPVLALVNKYISPVLGKMGCPELASIDNGLFSGFPGYNYNPRP